MRSLRTTTIAGAAITALILASAPVSAQAPDVRVGTARTSMLGADLSLTDLPVEVPALQVLDALTFASLDTDTNRNALGVPFSQVMVTPLRVGDQAIGQLQLHSNGTSSGSSENAATDALGAVGATVTPIVASATATDSSAQALVQGAVAELTAVLGTVGVDLDVSGITSAVDRTNSRALQGLSVGAIDIDLADLGLNADLLGSLPLGTLLSLIDQLPVALPADLQAVVGQVLGALVDLDAALAAVDAAAAELLVGAAQVTVVTEALADAEAALADAEAALADATGIQTQVVAATTVLDLVALLDDAALVAALDECSDFDLVALAELAAVELLAELTSIDAVLTDLETCADAAVAAATAVVTATTVAVATATAGQAEAVDALDLLADGLDLAALVATLTDLLGDLGGLPDLLAALDGLLPDLAGTSILSVSAFEVSITAIAGATEADSSATLVCSAVDVTILGEVFNAPSCKDGLDEIGAALALVDDAVATVTDLLNTLPLADVVSVGDLGLEIFGTLTEEVTTTDDGYVRAVAAMELLDLELPSISVDPSAIVDNLLGDALNGIEVPDVLGTLGLGTDGLPVGDAAADTLAGAIAAVDALDTTIADVTGIQTELGAVLSSVIDTDGLLAQLTAVTDLLATLELGDLGTLDVILTTPGMHLVIDPSSFAEYSVTAAPVTPVTPAAPAPVTPVTPAAPAPAPAPTTPAAPAPAPTPARAPTLPATGGGLALLGLLSAGGALALRRRDDA